VTTTDDRLERIFTVEQVAQSLSVTTVTVYRMLSDGRLQVSRSATGGAFVSRT